MFASKTTVVQNGKLPQDQQVNYMQKCIPLDNYYCFLSYNRENSSSDLIFFNARG